MYFSGNFRVPLKTKVKQFFTVKEQNVTRGKIGFDVFTTFILPAVDECTDLYTGVRFIV